MDIPLLMHQVTAGRFDAASETLRRGVAFPAVLGRICHAPCEKVCRRAQMDQPVSIRLTERHLADLELQPQCPQPHERRELDSRKVAVIGAGLTGLSAAFFLRQKGCLPSVYDEHENPGGKLRYGKVKDAVPREIVDFEVNMILDTGIVYCGDTRIGEGISFERLQEN